MGIKQDTVETISSESTNLALAFIKAVGLVLLIIIALLVIQSFAGVALNLVSDVVNFLIGLLP